MWKRQILWLFPVILAPLAQARDAAAKPGVSVCLLGAGNPPLIQQAKAITTHLYEEAGIDLTWRSPTSASDSPCIFITLSELTPEREHPAALGYAMPYAGGEIVVFYDRVRESMPPSLTATLLGHVFAHELAHVLQRQDWHSSTGMMKSRWEYGDYRDMARGRLAFTPADIAMILHGLEAWNSSRSLPDSPSQAIGGGM